MAVTSNNKQFLERARQAVMRGIIRGTEATRNEAISLILNTKKSGRVYRRRSVEHQASAPGEPPASDKGQLVNNINTRYDHVKLIGQVYSPLKKASYLEHGTQKMEPRPFLRPALANTRAKTSAFIQEEIQKEFSK